ncbi:unnamed protein product [Chrysoparadoxa australica]
MIHRVGAKELLQPVLARVRARLGRESCSVSQRWGKSGSLLQGNPSLPWIRCIHASAYVASANGEASGPLERVQTALLKQCGLVDEQVRAMTEQCPAEVLESDKFDSVLAWLEEAGLTREQQATMLLRLPQLLSFDPDEQLRPVWDWCLRLGIPAETLSTMVVRRPTLLTLSEADNLQPLLEWMREELGLTNSDVALMAQTDLGLLEVTSSGA